jgi:hypothetical protein
MIRNNEFLRRAYRLSLQFGFNPRRFFWGLMAIPGYVADLVRFRRDYAGRMYIAPSLHDRHESVGSASGGGISGKTFTLRARSI